MDNLNNAIEAAKTALIDQVQMYEYTISVESFDWQAFIQLQFDFNNALLRAVTLLEARYGQS